MEKQIYLEGVDLLDFFGINNSKINLIRNNFLKITVTARGNSLYLQGEEKELEIFEKKMALILDHYFQFGSLTDEIIYEILTAGVSSLEGSAAGDSDIIVFGNNGKPVRARTPNQRKLVEQSVTND